MEDCAGHHDWRELCLSDSQTLSASLCKFSHVLSASCWKQDVDAKAFGLLGFWALDSDFKRPMLVLSKLNNGLRPCLVS